MEKMDFRNAQERSPEAQLSLGTAVYRQGTPRRAQAEDRDIWSAESAGRPRIDQLPTPPPSLHTGRESKGLQAEPSTLGFEQPKYNM